MLQRIVRYIRNDLKEILSPAGLPPPPGTPLPPKWTLKDYKMAGRETANVKVTSFDVGFS